MTLVSSHQIKPFTSPVNTTGAVDANLVRGNDNIVRNAYVSHDADATIHFQSSTLAARPAAGVAGRKWMTEDAGVARLWYDTGAGWVELAIASNVVGPASATDNAVARFDGTTGKLIQNSSVTIDDSGNLSTGSGTLTTTTSVFWGSVGRLEAGGAGLADVQITQAAGSFRVINAGYSAALFSVAEATGNTTVGGSLAITGALSGVTTLGLNGKITKTNTAADTLFFESTSTSTGANYSRLVSTGGTYEQGIENSANTLYGVGAYNYFLAVPATRSLAFFVGGTGTVATFSGTGATVNGSLTVNSTTFTAAAFDSTYGQTDINVRVNGTAVAVFGSGASVTSTAGVDDVGVGTAGLNKAIVFATGTGYTERMRIAANGSLTVDTDTLFVDAVNNRVGVGTVSPSAKLHTLGGDVLFQRNGAAMIAEVAGDTQPVVRLNHTALSQVFDISIDGTTGNSFLRTNGARAMLFLTDSVERARIDASGNVGIGTVPSFKLDVSGTSRSNAFYAYGTSGSSGNMLFQADAGASAAFWITTKPNSSFHLGGNGATEPIGAIVISPSGVIGIGTTAPLGKVHINDGSARNFLALSDASQLGTAGIAIGSFNDDASAYRLLSIVSSGARFNSGVTIDGLAGTGTRMVTASATGVLATSPQGATIADPAGGGTVDAEARTAINTIIDRLQAHGLIA